MPNDHKPTKGLEGLIDEIFPCELIKKSVFGEETLNEPRKYVTRCKSLFYLTTAYFFSLYRKKVDDPAWSVDKCFEKYEAKKIPYTTIRVLNTLEELYNKYYVNDSIVAHILVNSQINITLRTPQDCSLDNVLQMPTELGLDEDDDAYVMNFIFEFEPVKDIRHLPDPEKVGREKFEELLEHFYFFKNIELKKEEDGNIIFEVKFGKKIKIDGEKVDSFTVNSHHTLISREDGLYYLTDMQRRRESNNTFLRATYSSIYDEQIKKYFDIGGNTKESEFFYIDENGKKNDYSESEFFQEITGRQMPEEGYSPELFCRGLNTGSYKYINRLSMALVDSTYGTEALSTLVSLMHKHQRELNIEDLDKRLSGKIDLINADDLVLSVLDPSVKEIGWRSSVVWDDIVSRLLIIESPREILSEFIEEDRNVFDKILDQIAYRFCNAVDTKKIVTDKNKEMKTAKDELIFLYFGGKMVDIDEEQIKVWINKLNAMIAAKLIVKSLAEVASTRASKKENGIKQKKTKESIGGSIYPSTLLLEGFKKKLSSTETDPGGLLERTDRILRHSLQMTLCTFSSLIKTLKPWSNYEIKTYGGQMSDEEIKNYKIQIETTFIDAFKSKYGELGSLSTSDLFIELVKTCNDCVDEKTGSITKMGNSFRIMTGKESPLEVMDIWGIFSLKDGVMCVVPDKSNEGYTLNEIREQCQKNGKEARNLVKIYVEKAYRMLQLLGGSLFDMDSFNDLTQRAAYPFVGTYVDKRLNMDYHSIHNFAIVNNEGEETRIHILSEFAYKVNEKYYIIPNLLRTDREWWIQPIMIECEKLNRIIKKEEIYEDIESDEE